MANEYATLAELKEARRITGSGEDAALQRALTRASRAIDRRTGRRFYRDGVVSQRTFPAAGRASSVGFIVDDIASEDGLVVESGIGHGTTSWSAVSAYVTMPDNAIVKGEAITALGAGAYWGTLGANGYLRVTAEWGWPAIPESIAEATLLLANRRFMRRDSPEGVAGWASEGVVRVSRFDPDVEDLIGPYALDGFA